MPYIDRDRTGRINALFYQPLQETTEFVPVSHPEVLAFLGEADKREYDLSRLVGEVIGVVEDVIVALLSTGTLSITDLSPSARKFARRDKLPGESLGGLMVDEGGVRLP